MVALLPVLLLPAVVGVGTRAPTVAQYRPTEYPAHVADLAEAHFVQVPMGAGAWAPAWVVVETDGDVHLVDAGGLVEVSPAAVGDGDDWTCWYTGVEIRLLAYKARPPWGEARLTVNSDSAVPTTRARQVAMAAWMAEHVPPQDPDLMGWLATLPP